MDVKDALRAFGLSNNESSVYLAALKLGTSPAQRIAGEAGLLRTTTYEILKALVEKGIVSYIIKEGIRNFEAADPKRLLELLKERHDILQKALPDLSAMKESVIEKPSIEVYEEKEGLRTILDDLLKSGCKKYKVIGNNSKFRESLSFYVESFIQKRLEKNIACEFIAEEGRETKELQKNDRKVKRITKTLRKLDKANAEIFIYEDRVAIFTLVKDHPIGILIKEKNISLLFDIIFNAISKSNQVE